MPPILESSIPTLATGSSNRKAASPKQASSVAASASPGTPLIGASTYAKLVRAALDKTDAASLSPKLLKLAHARNAVYQAMLLMDGAMKQTNPQVKDGTPDASVYNKLRSLRGTVEGVFKEFPLEVR